jgi:transposase
MKSPIYVRSLTEQEQHLLEDELRSSDAFRLRRAQYLLASARKQTPKQIASNYGGCVQNVRNVINAFNARDLDALNRLSNRPKSAKPLLGEAHLAKLQHLLHQSPRIFDKPTSLWTQDLLAQVAFEQGLTKAVVSDETIRRALARLGANWKRAKHWISSPDPLYTLKKSGESVCSISLQPIPSGC